MNRRVHPGIRVPAQPDRREENPDWPGNCKVKSWNSG